MKNLDYLFAAYTAVWMLLFVYIVALARRNRSLGEEIDELRRLLERRSDAPDRDSDET